jgi:AGCS family alanine or glycine:cation symporter
MVLYIIITHIEDIPTVFTSIFREAFSLKAGWGALIGVALIGARRAALVNDAGVGTASIMHGASRNDQPVREGLVAMLGPSIDSGLVCTLTAFAILLCGDINVEGVQGLQVAMTAFGNAIPGGKYLLMLIVICFGMSSMFSYSFYGNRCASYLFGAKNAKYYTYFFILSLIVFAVVPLSAAVGVCDLFYGLMAFPTMIAILKLSPKVKQATKEYFAKTKNKSL